MIYLEAFLSTLGSGVIAVLGLIVLQRFVSSHWHKAMRDPEQLLPMIFVAWVIIFLTLVGATAPIWL